MAEVSNFHHGKIMREESGSSGVKIIECSKEGVQIRTTETMFRISLNRFHQLPDNRADRVMGKILYISVPVIYWATDKSTDFSGRHSL